MGGMVKSICVLSPIHPLTSSPCHVSHRAGTTAPPQMNASPRKGVREMLKLCQKAMLAAFGILVLGTAALQAAPPEASAMLAPQFAPKQPGVVVTTPTANEIPSCKVELVTGPGDASGWLLKDSKGQPVRKF